MFFDNLSDSFLNSEVFFFIIFLFVAVVLIVLILVVVLVLVLIVHDQLPPFRIGTGIVCPLLK